MAMLWLHIQGYGTSPEELKHNLEEETSSSASQDCFAADLAAAGRIAVQICLRQRLHADADDTSFWQDQASLVRDSLEPRADVTKGVLDLPGCTCSKITELHALQARRLPQAWQDFVRVCFRLPAATDGTAALLADDFFPLPVRAAYFFLSSLQPQTHARGKPLKIAQRILLGGRQLWSHAGTHVLTLCKSWPQCRLAKRRNARISSGSCARQRTFGHQ